MSGIQRASLVASVGCLVALVWAAGCLAPGNAPHLPGHTTAERQSVLLNDIARQVSLYSSLYHNVPTMNDLIRMECLSSGDFTGSDITPAQIRIDTAGRVTVEPP